MIISGEWEAGRGRREGGDEEVQTTIYKINKLQGNIVHYRKYS